MRLRRLIPGMAGLALMAVMLLACGSEAPTAPSSAREAPAEVAQEAAQSSDPAAPPEVAEAKAAPAPVIVPVLAASIPDFVGTQEWINSEPTLIRDLTSQGRTVLVDFWTYSCYNCVNVFPSLRAWHDAYDDLGLTIVGVHTPEFKFEHDLGNLVAAVEEHGLDYPIVQDNDYATWRAFGNRHWPSLFLIDSDGRLRYRHIGEGAYAETEGAVRALLIEAGADLGGVAPVYP